jgi:hypothetical protein
MMGTSTEAGRDATERAYPSPDVTGIRSDNPENACFNQCVLINKEDSIHELSTAHRTIRA